MVLELEGRLAEETCADCLAFVALLKYSRSGGFSSEPCLFFFNLRDAYFIVR